MSLHADALGLLGGWRPREHDQEELRRRYVEHLRAHPDGASRSCYPAHLTASTLVVSPRADRVLLTLHARAGRWFQLGGHCEPSDETLLGAARREASEESGLTGLVMDPLPVQLSEHAVPFCDPRGGVRHLDVRFVAVATEVVDPACSKESLDVRWWPADELPDPDPGMVELVRLGRARLGLPGPDRAGAQPSTGSSPGGGSTRDAADQPTR